MHLFLVTAERHISHIAENYPTADDMGLALTSKNELAITCDAFSVMT